MIYMNLKIKKMKQYLQKTTLTKFEIIINKLSIHTFSNPKKRTITR